MADRMMCVKCGVTFRGDFCPRCVDRFTADGLRECVECGKRYRGFECPKCSNPVPVSVKDKAIRSALIEQDYDLAKETLTLLAELAQTMASIDWGSEAEEELASEVQTLILKRMRRLLDEGLGGEQFQPQPLAPGIEYATNRIAELATTLMQVDKTLIEFSGHMSLVAYETLKKALYSDIAKLETSSSVLVELTKAQTRIAELEAELCEDDEPGFVRVSQMAFDKLIDAERELNEIKALRDKASDITKPPEGELTMNERAWEASGLEKPAPSVSFSYNERVK